MCVFFICKIGVSVRTHLLRSYIFDVDYTNAYIFTYAVCALAHILQSTIIFIILDGFAVRRTRAFPCRLLSVLCIIYRCR